MSDDDALRQLAMQAGISIDWRNYANEPRTVKPDALRAVLGAMGLPCDDKDDIADSRQRLTPVPGIAGLAPLITATADAPTRIPVHPDSPRSAVILPKTGGERDVRLHAYRDGVEIPVISEPGYHRLLIGPREIVLAVAPARASGVRDLESGGRPWGLAAQIYGLRHDGDGGIGDAEAVAQLAEAAAGRGADMLALESHPCAVPAEPHQYGPYSPSSRLFLNPLHAAPALLFGAERVGEAVVQAGVAEEYARLERLS